MTRNDSRSASQPNPAELRGIFGANLREMSQSAASISALCRDLGINRTQFNRYLAGESFPRPDVLDRICSFFGVDARILLEPVAQLSKPKAGLLNHPFITDFVGAGMSDLSEETFPSGFYHFSRAAFTDSERFVVGLVHIRREDGFTFLRGFEPKEALALHNMPTDPQTREFRGMVLPQAEGIAMLVSRRDAVTTSFNYLSRMPALAKHYWVGYVVRTTQENPTGRRAARLVYEYLGHDTRQVLRAARSAGYVAADDLVPFHRRQLRIGEPFV
ncbi:MAG: XRE family transcriptional regulator [Rhodobacteraceae bacterium]|jgi:transcriptional regulator with XRE-family HTH domain|nr:MULTISPECIES: helix-turn-helix transcriptional regulator [Salipiger]MAB07411.1 XRE family transcriptional regulator [Paracoccaceae bacterium]SFB87252.1 transcriptional regulator, XRE family [Salipiger profundus]